MSSTYFIEFLSSPSHFPVSYLITFLILPGARGLRAAKPLIPRHTLPPSHTTIPLTHTHTLTLAHALPLPLTHAHTITHQVLGV